MLSLESVRRVLGDGYQLTSPGAGIIDVALISSNKARLCEVQLRDQAHLVAVRDLAVPEALRGEGVGTRVLDDLIAWADANDHPLTLRARHGTNRNPDHDRRLAKWFATRGFVPAGGITMTRCPGGNPP